MLKREGPPNYHRRQSTCSSDRPGNSLPGLADEIARDLLKNGILRLSRPLKEEGYVEDQSPNQN